MKYTATLQQLTLKIKKSLCKSVLNILVTGAKADYIGANLASEITEEDLQRSHKCNY